MALIHETLSNFRNGSATAKPIFTGTEPQPIWLRNNSDKITWTCNLSNDPANNIPFWLPRGADPILITEEYSWDQLKESHEFRVLLGKMKRGVMAIQVLSPEEAEAHYEGQARAKGLKSAAAAYALVRAQYAASRGGGNSSPVTNRDEAGDFTFAPPKSAQDLEAYARGTKTPQDAQAARPGPDVLRNDGLIRTAAAVAAAERQPAAHLTREEMLSRMAAVVDAQPLNVEPPRQENAPLMRPFARLDSPDAGETLPLDAYGAPSAGPVVMMAVGVRPLVQSLCAQVSRSTPVDKQIDGETFIRALVSIKDLTNQELEFLANPRNGRYASVISWAQRELDKRSEPEPDNFAALIEELSASPAASKDTPA